MAELLIITRNPRTYSHTRFYEMARDFGHLVDVLITSDFCWGLPKKYDFVLHRDSGISFDDVDLVIAKSLESIGCPVLNSTSTLHRLRGKDNQFQFFQSEGLPYIPTLITRGLSNLESLFPESKEVIVKTIRGNQGRGVELYKRQDLDKILVQNFERKDERYIVQPRMKFLKEFRVLILGNEIQGVMQKTCLDDFRANAKRTENKAVPASDEIKNLTEKVIEHFPNQFLGLDFGLTSEGLFLIEINTTPGFEVFDEVFNTNIAKKLWETYL